MILLEPGNRILGETIRSRVEGCQVETEKEKKRNACDVNLCDFDNASYHVVVTPEEPGFAYVSLSIPCFGAIKDNGADESFKKAYGDSVVAPNDGRDVAIRVKVDGLDEKATEDLVAKVSLMKQHLLAGVFRRSLSWLKNGGAKPAPFRFNLRDDTRVYIIPGEDRVGIVFSMDFPDRVDTAVARIFLQEFQEARRTIQASLPVVYAPAPPRELGEHWGIKESSGDLGFITFSVMKEHVRTEEAVDKVCHNLQMFRNYVQYHIKCAKAYFHSRMRARVRSLLKVLNRAKTEDEDETKKKKKTFSGKTFTQK